MGKEGKEKNRQSSALFPDVIGPQGAFDSFGNGEVLFQKKKNHLPAMGWNSWNAFGSGNTEALTLAMGERICALGLRELGYSYVVLDDGCYKQERVRGKLSNEETKFPSGFKKLSDDLHAMGLRFGMYNDIGTNLCAGAAVGTCGHEAEDAKSYVDWGVDFLKVDNCYYPFDNATFSNPENARFTYAPHIRGIRVGGKAYTAGKDGRLTGIRAGLRGAEGYADGRFAAGIGTFDGTGPRYSPVGLRSSELVFEVSVGSARDANLSVEYATGKREGVGAWLQIAANDEMLYDALLPETKEETTFVWSDPIRIRLKKGVNTIRLMNHRRQENTLNSYARLLKELQRLAPERDILYSACEWGKTQPQNWAYKVCDSWRILNDITFRVGRDGDPGHGDWKGDYTCSVTSQYNKAVIMDGFSGLSKGWNDPDMLMIGMDGLTPAQNRSHMAMWCMMNAPLMLGLDLRRVEKGDALYEIIANKELIGINQDPLGIQARRIYCSLAQTKPHRTYVRDTDRVDILARPLEGGRFALSFLNLSEQAKKDGWQVDISVIKKHFGKLIPEADAYEVLDVWTKKTKRVRGDVFGISSLKPCENVTWIVTPR